MTTINEFFMKLIGRVKIQELDMVQYIGPKKKGLTPNKFYKLLDYTGSGVSKDYKISYKFEDDLGWGNTIWSNEVGKTIFKDIWVSKDSLAGITSQLSFDTTLRNYKPLKRKDEQTWN